MRSDFSFKTSNVELWDRSQLGQMNLTRRRKSLYFKVRLLVFLHRDCSDGYFIVGRERELCHESQKLTVRGGLVGCTLLTVDFKT